MIVLLSTMLSAAADPGAERGLHALRDEWGAWPNRATLDERDADYANACRLGWRPGCAPDRWRDDEGQPDPELLEAALTPACERGDVLACFAVHRFGPGPGFTTEQLYAQCEGGLAPACTMVAEAMHDADPERSRELLDRACAGTGVADAPLPRDPLACGRYGDRYDDPVRLADACRSGDGRACASWSDHADDAAEQEARTLLGCEGGHAPSCLVVAASIEAGLPAGPSLDRVPEPEEAQRRADRHDLLERACGLGELAACTEAARNRALGRGVPVDLPAAHDGYWDACQRGDGAGCVFLAEAILDRETDVFGVTPRQLYDRGCELDNSLSCVRSRTYDRRQRFATRRLLAVGYARIYPLITARPWLGSSTGLVAEVGLPRPGIHTIRRRVRLILDQGALDLAFNAFDRRATPENVSTFAGEWRQDPVVGKPWGARLAVGSQYWQGAPSYDDDALLEAVPGEATETFDLVTFVSRFDLERTVRDNPRIGVQLSLSSITAWSTLERETPEGSVGRAVLSVFRRAPTDEAMPMRGAASELSLYVGAASQLERGHTGVWLTDRRSLPVVRAGSGRPLISLTTDVAGGLRVGEVPDWLAHHHPPRLSPNLGSWQLLRGQPAALLRGKLPVRARAGMRWWIAEYHGLPRHVGFYLTPFVEAGTAVPDPAALTRTRWRSDGGLTATVTWRRRTTLHVEALLVSDLDDGGFDVVPSLLLTQLLEPWN